MYDFIKSIILDRKVMPGDKIFTDKMQSDIGVSRTPIIMALKMLEREMLITTKPRRGHYVRTFIKISNLSIHPGNDSDRLEENMDASFRLRS